MSGVPFLQTAHEKEAGLLPAGMRRERKMLPWVISLILELKIGHKNYWKWAKKIVILFYLTESFCIFAVSPRLYVVCSSVFLYSWFYFSDLIKEQMERKDRLSHELVRHKERLQMMQKDVHSMETDLKSRLGAPASFIMVNTNQFRICGIIFFLQLF